MKAKLITVVIAILFVLALVFTTGSPAGPNAVAAAATGAESGQPAAAGEPHPEIREAIASLRRAKGHMEHAAHDFGGHRVEAIRATDAAIQQLEDCLRYDKD
jgi:hypothetical protein